MRKVKFTGVSVGFINKRERIATYDKFNEILPVLLEDLISAFTKNADRITKRAACIHRCKIFQ